jgi:hypothetical protein
MGKTENPAVNGDSTINDQPLRLRDGISRDVDLNQQCRVAEALTHAS